MRGGNQRELAGSNVSLTADRRVEFRIGLNIGDVMVDGDTSTARARTSGAAGTDGVRASP